MSYVYTWYGMGIAAFVYAYIFLRKNPSIAATIAKRKENQRIEAINKRNQKKQIAMDERNKKINNIS